MPFTGYYNPPIQGGENLWPPPEPADLGAGYAVSFTGEGSGPIPYNNQVSLYIPHSGGHWMKGKSRKLHAIHVAYNIWPMHHTFSQILHISNGICLKINLALRLQQLVCGGKYKVFECC